MSMFNFGALFITRHGVSFFGVIDDGRYKWKNIEVIIINGQYIAVILAIGENNIILLPRVY